MCAVPSHGIPIGMTFPWTSLCLAVQHERQFTGFPAQWYSRSFNCCRLAMAVQYIKFFFFWTDNFFSCNYCTPLLIILEHRFVRIPLCLFLMIRMRGVEISALSIRCLICAQARYPIFVFDYQFVRRSTPSWQNVNVLTMQQLLFVLF